MKLSFGIVLVAVAVLGCSAVSISASPVSNAHLRTLRKTQAVPDCSIPSNQSPECKSVDSYNPHDVESGQIDEYGLPQPISDPNVTPSTSSLNPPATPLPADPATPLAAEPITPSITPLAVEPATPLPAEPITPLAAEPITPPTAESPPTDDPTTTTFTVPLNPSPQPDNVFSPPMLPVNTPNGILCNQLPSNAGPIQCIQPVTPPTAA